MKRLIMSLLSAGLVVLAGSGAVVADNHEVEFLVIPVELYACTYNEGKGPRDLDAPISKYNQWSDRKGIDDYAAWTLTPYYTGPGANGGFDVIWMGAAKDAAALGRGQDMWLADSDGIQEEFDEVVNCGAHGSYASINFKPTPEGATPENSVLTLSDCSYQEGASFEALNTSMAAWSAHLTESGSNAGVFHWYPVYGAGGEDFSFKWLEAHESLESMGADFDRYGNGRGFEKYGELFGELIECDAARVYLAKNHRFVQLR